MTTEHNEARSAGMLKWWLLMMVVPSLGLLGFMEPALRSADTLPDDASATEPSGTRADAPRKVTAANPARMAAEAVAAAAPSSGNPHRVHVPTAPPSPRADGRDVAVIGAEVAAVAQSTRTPGTTAPPLSPVPATTHKAADSAQDGAGEPSADGNGAARPPAPGTAQRFRQLLNDWGRQDPDPEWTADTRELLEQSAEAAGLQKGNVLSTDCREALCRVELSFPDLKSAAEFQRNSFQTGQKYDFRQTRAAHFEDPESGEPTVGMTQWEVFMARDGGPSAIGNPGESAGLDPSAIAANALAGEGAAMAAPHAWMVDTQQPPAQVEAAPLASP